MAQAVNCLNSVKKCPKRAMELSDKFNDYNSFDNPNKITAKDFKGAKKSGNQLIAELPPLSVVELELK